MVEIRGGTGGDEACIFAGDLFRMYTRFCEKKHWKIEVNDFNEGTSGGYKDISFTVTGEGVYGLLKYESGVHRVQRVPATETQGRIHTSAAGVVVLPEAEEFDVELNMSDVRIDTFCASVLNFVLENGLDRLKERQLREMLRFANAAAYLVTTKKGAIRSMPEKAEVLEILAHH